MTVEELLCDEEQKMRREVWSLCSFWRPSNAIYFRDIVGRAKGSIQEQIGPDREVAARHSLAKTLLAL
jgi:hypothetical protein